MTDQIASDWTLSMKKTRPATTEWRALGGDRIALRIAGHEMECRLPAEDYEAIDLKPDTEWHPCKITVELPNVKR